MDRGEVIANGTHDELVEIVGELDRIDLITNTPTDQIFETWKRVAGVQKITSENGTLTLLAKDSNQVLPELFQAAAAADVRITSVDIQEPNLEAVFLHLTGRALRN
jgi:ABC-2 type transport system ATP-binding protein